MSTPSWYEDSLLRAIILINTKEFKRLTWGSEERTPNRRKVIGLSKNLSRSIFLSVEL